MCNLYDSGTTQHIKANNRNRDAKDQQRLKSQLTRNSSLKFSLPDHPSLVSSASRVGVISTRPRASTTISLQRVVDADNGSISACNGHEGTNNNNKGAPANHKTPLGRLALLALVPVVIEPHTSVRLEAHHCTQESADERHESSEDRDGAGDDVGDDGNAACAAQPGSPMHNTVGVEVLGASQQTDKEVLGGNLGHVSKILTGKR